MQPTSALNIYFNQKYTSLMITTPTHYKLFNLEEIDTTLNVRAIVQKQGILWAGALWDELICAMILEEQQEQLIVWNLKAQTIKDVHEYSDAGLITAVKTNGKIVVVFFETRFQIHNVNDMTSTISSKDISPNPDAICDFANLSDRYSFIAYPHYTNEQERQRGIIQIYDTGSIIRTPNTGKVHSIVVDDRPIVAIAFSPSGAEIATANTLGALIKVFSSTSGAKLCELRRGHTGAFIRSLLFSTCGKYLISSSNTTSIHIYELKKADDGPRTVRTRLLPSFLTQPRAFAKAKLKVAGSGIAFGIVSLQNGLRLMVSTYYGTLYVYKIDIDNGGECEMIKKYNLLDESFKLDVALSPTRRNVGDAPYTSAAASSSLAGTSISETAASQSAAIAFGLVGMSIEDPLTHRSDSSN